MIMYGSSIDRKDSVGVLSSEIFYVSSIDGKPTVDLLSMGSLLWVFVDGLLILCFLEVLCRWRISFFVDKTD